MTATIKKPPVVFFALAFIARFIWFIYAQTVPTSDFRYYVILAQNFIETGSIFIDSNFAFTRQPAWIVTLSLLGPLLASDTAVALFCILLSSLLVPLFWGLMKDLGVKQKNANLATAVLALWPPFIQFSPVAGAEHLSLLILGMAASITLKLYVGIKQKNSDKIISRNWILIGLINSVGILNRAENLFLGPALSIFVVLLYNRIEDNQQRSRIEGKSRKKIIIKTVGSFSVIPFLVSTINLLRPNGGFGISSWGAANMLQTINPNGYYGYDPIWNKYGYTFETQQQGYKLILNMVTDHPGLVFKGIASGIANFLSTPPNYGIDWGFTCWSKEICASENRRTNIHGEVLEHLLRVNNLILYFIVLVSIGIALCLLGLIKKSFLRAIAILSIVIIPSFITSALLAPFSSRYRIVLDLAIFIFVSSQIDLAKTISIGDLSSKKSIKEKNKTNSEHRITMFTS